MFIAKLHSRSQDRKETQLTSDQGRFLTCNRRPFPQSVVKGMFYWGNRLML